VVSMYGCALSPALAAMPCPQRTLLCLVPSARCCALSPAHAAVPCPQRTLLCLVPSARCCALSPAHAAMPCPQRTLLCLVPSARCCALRAPTSTSVLNGKSGRVAICQLNPLCVFRSNILPHCVLTRKCFCDDEKRCDVAYHLPHILHS